MASLLSPLMVVGDDTSFRYLMQRYAQKLAYPVVLAHFAEDIVALALRETPAVVIVELDFPGERGLAILTALKAVPLTAAIPIILCSWTDETEYDLDEGAAALYLRKPILYDDFRTALADVGVAVGLSQEAPACET